MPPGELPAHRPELPRSDSPPHRAGEPSGSPCPGLPWLCRSRRDLQGARARLGVLLPARPDGGHIALPTHRRRRRRGDHSGGTATSSPLELGVRWGSRPALGWTCGRLGPPRRRLPGPTSAACGPAVCGSPLRHHCAAGVALPSTRRRSSSLLRRYTFPSPAAYGGFRGVFRASRCSVEDDENFCSADCAAAVGVDAPTHAGRHSGPSEPVACRRLLGRHLARRREALGLRPQ
mmetsp:Transcript_19375/g.56438  ORF Transcript_19375/g.56438 Transcript_19375/m.56438 type:complete len:233 (+) Transcript_19375:2050-2748(+)